jgi:hypothetical protein
MTDNKTDLDNIVMMLGYLCVSTEIEASIGRKVEILDRFKLEDNQKAAICGVKPQAIRDARQRSKKSKK